MRLPPEEARSRFARSPVARLATVGEAAVPHLVPITFVIDQDVLYFVIDHKPKTTWNVQRLRNIRQNDRVAVLADQYGDDWSALWWARADGRAEIWGEPDRRARPVELLRRKYPQYQAAVPAGPVVAITVARWSGWSFR